MSDLLTDAARGAAIGLPFGGPVGAAIGGLGGVVAHYAPSLLSDLFGPNEQSAVQAAKSAVQVVQNVTGTDDPGKVFTAAADPAVDSALRVRLAQISADLRRSVLDAQNQAQATQVAAIGQQMQGQISALQAQLADVANARSSMMTLAAGSSRLVWAPVAVTATVLAGFFSVATLVLLKQLDPNSVLVGGLLSMATGVVSYWTGNNASSSNNRQQLVDMANKAADSVSPSAAAALLASSARGR